MTPDNSSQQTPPPATLPAMQPMGEAQPLSQAPEQTANPTQAASGTDALQRASTQARQVIVQHQHQPYELSDAFAKLKARYLAEQFHINPNPAEK